MSNDTTHTPEAPETDEVQDDPRDAIIVRLNAALEEALAELELDLAA